MYIATIDYANEQIFIDLNQIHNLFSFVGNGIYNTFVKSQFIEFTNEWINIVVVEFNECYNGGTPLAVWGQVNEICRNLVYENNIVQEFVINSSDNKLEIALCETFQAII